MLPHEGRGDDPGRGGWGEGFSPDVRSGLLKAGAAALPECADEGGDDE